MVASWKCACGRATGSTHTGSACQDHFAVESEGEKIFIAVSDGAGSAALGAVGAQIVAQSFVELAKKLDDALEAATRPQLRELFLEIQRRVVARSRVDGIPVGSYSSTLVGVAIGAQGGFVLQVGDGVAVVKLGGRLQVPLRPQPAEALNTTVFVTSASAKAKLQVVKLKKPVESIAVMSDGLQHLVVDVHSCVPHAPFFQSVFSKVAELDSEAASQWVQTVLTSRQVTERTDDDTCLVVAVRSDT